jgi:endonuclease/exonuclease/phosphatase family metal-dependent hydrolase
VLALGAIAAVAAFSGPPLRVATYNILAGKRGVDRIVETLRGIDADVIALQEVDRNTRRCGRSDEPRIVAEELGLEVAFVRHTMATILRDGCARGGATWPSTFPVLRIDYVWTSADLLPAHCATPQSAASDHLPLVVDLRRLGPHSGVKSTRRPDRSTQPG